MVRLILAGVVVIGFTLLAAVGQASPEVQLALLAEPEMPAPTASPTEAGKPSPAVKTEPVGQLEEETGRPLDLFYGAGARMRWVSVPAWMLNLFTKKNVPLSSYAFAVEGFRRKGNFDFVLAFGYQNMSPDDGNWLGKDHPAASDTDLVQFRGLAFWSLDASFIWHNWFNKSFGIHGGGGLGVGFVTGHMLRTSNGGCNDGNAGDVTMCKPIVCTTPGACTEQQLQATEIGPTSRLQDGPGSPHRFADDNVPPAIPIVNLVLGLDFRIPNLPGWEAKIEGGFYDAFFLGGGIGYAF